VLKADAEAICRWYSAPSCSVQQLAAGKPQHATCLAGSHSCIQFIQCKVACSVLLLSDQYYGIVRERRTP